MKLCTKCLENKELDCFEIRKRKNCKDRPTSWCKLCRNKKRVEYFKRNPEKKKMYYSKYSARGVAKRLKRVYNISSQEYEDLKKKQNNCCAICFRNELEVKKLHVDHCHSTGNVRGLLCINCNTAIGSLKHSPDLLKSAVSYLQK